jgi:hypothetical protein
MALTIPVDRQDAISLEEFVSDVEAILDPADQSTLLALAPRLRQLANNRRFLADFISAQLGAWDQFDLDNLYTGQVFGLASGKAYLVRANVWEPPRPSDRSGQLDQLFMYQQPHDHNFTFLTVGYLGAGYQTTIYECDPESVTGIIGDPVDMTFCETTTLPEGKVMLYRAGRDIHRQEHPSEYSISLNLMVRDPAFAGREQHYFDLESRTITGSMKASPAHPRLSCQLARFVGGASTIANLEVIRQHNPQPEVRLAAIDSLAALCPGDALALWTAALEDRHPLVRQVARQAVNRIESGAPVDLEALLPL